MGSNGSLDLIKTALGFFLFNFFFNFIIYNFWY